MITAVLFVALMVLIIAGAPLGFAMGASGALGLFLLGGLDTLYGILSNVPMSTVASYELITIPLFVLMAEFIIISQIADELFDSMVVWVGRLPGGLGVATALAGAGFAAVSGSSTVGAATLASTSLPAMLKRGYEPRMANGVVAISGTLCMLIPPSVALVLYSILADQSIAKLLIAAVMPGLFITLVISGTVLALVWLDPKRAPAGRKYTFFEKIASLHATGPMLLLMFLVTGSIYLGIATPTEAAALGASGAFCLAALRRKMSFPAFRLAVISATKTTAMILTILIGAHVFGYALALTQSTQTMVQAIAGLDVNRYVIIALIFMFLLVLGCFLDQFAIMILTVPILLPLIAALGFSPIWFGVLFVVVAEVGMVTPPVGLNAFVVARYTGRPVEEVFAGVLPHVVAHVLAIMVLTAWPEIVLWLPSRM